MTNRKLTRSFDSVKKIFLKIVIGVVLACILFVCFLYTNNEIGVTSSKLEADIRSSQKIKDDWTVDGSVSSTMAAYISYPQDLSDHSFSVYVNRPGLSFGYFFRGGGTHIPHSSLLIPHFPLCILPLNPTNLIELISVFTKMRKIILNLLTFLYGCGIV